MLAAGCCSNAEGEGEERVFVCLLTCVASKDSNEGLERWDDGEEIVKDEREGVTKTCGGEEAVISCHALSYLACRVRSTVYLGRYC